MLSTGFWPKFALRPVIDSDSRRLDSSTVAQIYFENIKIMQAQIWRRACGLEQYDAKAHGNSRHSTRDKRLATLVGASAGNDVEWQTAEFCRKYNYIKNTKRTLLEMSKFFFYFSGCIYKHFISATKDVIVKTATVCPATVCPATVWSRL